MMEAATGLKGHLTRASLQVAPPGGLLLAHLADRTGRRRANGRFHRRDVWLAAPCRDSYVNGCERPSSYGDLRGGHQSIISQNSDSNRHT